MKEPTVTDEIRLAVPAAADFARLARLTVAGLASRMGFSYDEVEDLRIAVGEVCSLLVGPAPSDPAGGSITIVYKLEGDVLDVEATTDAADPPTPAPGALGLSRQIIDAVVDHSDLDLASKRIRLRKRRGAD